MPQIVLIAAVARNGVIGADNDMPWKLSSDLKRLKRLTVGKPVVVGRKTFLSFGGKPLPGRPHVIVSRDAAYAPEGAEAQTTVPAAFSRAVQLANDLGVDEVYCLGGGQIYSEAIRFADRLEITEVDAHPDGDTRFPEIAQDAWKEISRVPAERTERDSADMVFVTYRRKVEKPAETPA